MMAWKELAFDICMLVLSIILSVQSFRYPLDSALFPRVLSILLLLFSLLLIIRTLRQPLREDSTGRIRATFFSRMKSVPVVVFTSTALYILMIPILGFLVSTTLFIIGSIYFRNRKKLIVGSIYGICVSAAIYILFQIFLGVTLPSGWLM